MGRELILATARPTSPSSASILITSAPMSPSIELATGPNWYIVQSSTRSPFIGPFTPFSFVVLITTA